MTTAIVLSTLFFLLLHAVTWRAVDAPFDVVLKLSRGAASVVLAGLGFYALYRWLPLWRQTFIAQHDSGSWLFYVICFLCGHLLADTLWLGYGARLGSAPRRDLILHHALGFVVCGLAFYFQAGYALIAAALTTEMLPVTTGLDGVGKAAGRLRLRRLSARLGLAVLWGWRIPCWLLLFAGVSWNLRTGNVLEPLRWVYPICLVMAVAILAFDVYWTRDYLRILERLGQRPAT